MKKLLILAAISSRLFAAEASFESRMEPESITVGDRVTLEMTLHSSEPASMPELEEVFHEHIEVLDRVSGKAVQTQTGWKLTETLTLTCFRTNAVPIELFTTNRVEIPFDPPLSVKLPFLTLEMRSVLTDTNDVLLSSAFQTPDLRSEQARKRDRIVLTGILTAILLIIAAIAFYLWRRSRRPAPPPPPPRWDLLALKALAALKDSEEWKTQDLDAAAVRMSHILREYIEGRFQIRAPESTTEEFLESTRDHQPWDRDLQQRLEEFLTRTDEIKFAGGRPPMEAMETLCETAEAFVRATPQAETPS